MEKFNISRFGRTLRWTIQDSKKELISIISIMFFVYLAIFAISIIAASKDLKGYMMACLFAYTVLISIAGCWIFNNMKTKEERIAFMMLPATDLEKYLSRYLYVTVFWIIGGIAAFIAADFLGTLIRYLLGYGSLFEGTRTIVRLCFHETIQIGSLRFEGPLLVLTIASTVFGHSFNIFGGTIFRRRQLILTWVLQSAISMPVSWILALSFHTVDFEYVIGKVLTPGGMYIGSAVYIVLTALMYVLSYKIFRRMQVISNKWINVW